MTKKTVCIMTSVHHYNDVRIYQKQAKALKQAGFDVTVLCSNLKDNLSNWEDKDGIKFIKLDLPKKRLSRILKASNCFYKKAKQLNCDYYHFHDPELIKAGIKLSKNAKVIYDVHEDVPRQILNKPYLKPFVAKLASRIFEKRENRLAKKFYAIVVATPLIFDRFISLNNNTILVCNYPKLEEFTINDVEFKNRENSVCYIGGITKIRGIFEMLNAVENSNIKLVLAGEFENEQLKQQATEHKGFKNVDYMGFIGRQEISELLSNVKAGLVTLHPIPQYEDSLPVKMFEYMASCVPVIASDFPYWKEIIEDAQCGICVDPLSPKDIQNAINYILDNPKKAEEMGENGRKKVLEKYNWDIEKKKLIDFYLK